MVNPFSNFAQQLSTMAEIQQCENTINDAFDALERDITKSPYEFTQKDKWIRDCKKKIDIVAKQIQQYEYYLNDIPKSQNGKYVGTLKTFKSRLAKLKATFQGKQGKNQNEDLFTGKQKSKALDQMNAQELVERGDATQQKMFEMLESMDITLEQGLALADQINLELNRQIEQLDRMTAKVEDTGSALKRAEKQLNYFKKVVNCDWCLMGMLFLILIAAITLIILAVKKG